MQRVTRRDALTQMAITGFAAAQTNVLAADVTQKSQLGIVAYDCAIRRKWLSQRDSKFDLFEPLTFLKHCHSLGAGGMQVSLGVLTAPRIRELRHYAEQHSLFIEGIVNPPKDDSEIGRFDAEIRTAAEVGALAVRTVVMPGRRYEQFKSLAEVREAEATALKMLELAAPIVIRHRVRLAVENHKDQRIDERLKLYKQLACEFIGATVDTGNSVALLDDPYGAIEALAPYAFSVHLKDQALSEYADGFLLGDIPLGEGAFDLARMVGILKRAKPELRFQLELITRNPLKVPCLTDGFWNVMPENARPDLVRTLNFVRTHSTTKQQVTPLSLQEQLELEDANIAACLRYSREQLGM